MEKIIFDYSKLKGRIKEKFGTQKAFSKAIGMQESSLTVKLTGTQYFSQRNIYKIIRVLDIDPRDVTAYFFTV